MRVRHTQARLQCRAITSKALVNRTRTKVVNIALTFSVIAGLDPAIHPLRKSLAKSDGCAGLRLAEAASAAQAGQARA